VNHKQKYIAVVGVSENPDKFGHKIFKDLVNAKYKLDGINLNGGNLFGRKIYNDLKQLPSVPDTVVLVVHPEQSEIIVDECIELGIKEIWMQPGAESAAAIEKAKKAGIEIISNSCFMVREQVW
jgi:predicted CoA-binding protein